MQDLRRLSLSRSFVYGVPESRCMRDNIHFVFEFVKEFGAEALTRAGSPFIYYDYFNIFKRFHISMNLEQTRGLGAPSVA